MSKATQPQEQTQRVCEECGEVVSLGKKDNRQLMVSCDCEGRQIKVRRATPQSWS